MKKLLIIIVAIVVIVVTLRICDGYRYDYKKDIGNSRVDTGRIATIKLKTGHIIMFYNNGDSGYFTDAPECSMCFQNELQKKREDSLKNVFKEIRKPIQDTVVVEEKEEMTDSVS